MDKYFEATQDAGKQFYQNLSGKGEIVMLNLLNFKEKADYSSINHLRPNKESKW